MAEVQLSLVREEHVEVQLLRQAAVHREGRGVQGDRLRGVVVRAQDLGVPTARAAPEVGALEHGDVADPVLGREVVRERESVHPAADDHDVVSVAQLPTREVRPSPEQAAHAGLPDVSNAFPQVRLPVRGHETRIASPSTNTRATTRATSP